MPLRMYAQTSPWLGWDEIDLDAIGLHDLKIKSSYSQPRQVEFKCVLPQHELPTGLRDGIVLFDEDLGYSFASPQFEGHVLDISPGKSTYEVNVKCMDATRRATEETYVMSSPWAAGTGTGSGPYMPLEGTSAYPRLVVNTTIENDDDWAFTRVFDYTMGQILQLLFDDALPALRFANAAPASGVPYESTDLANFTYKPQEKITFESMTLRRAINQLLPMEPKFKMIFVPGTRKWRFYDLTAAPSVTITLNTPDANLQVLSGEIIRSLEDRATAVKFYGPERTVMDQVTTASGSGLGSGGLDYFGSGMLVETCNGDPLIAYRIFQVHDPAKRRLARLLPLEIWIQAGQFLWVKRRTPTLQAWFSGQSWPDTIWGITFDTARGKVYTPNWVTQYRETPPSGECHNLLPYNVVFNFAYLGTPFIARYPETGFGGTAYDDAGMAVEEKIYDDMLAIGYELNNPVTSSGRVAQFTQLAKQIHEGKRDIVYTGMLVLDGIHSEFLNLNRRVNIAANDPDGNPITTGWESAGMQVTECELDYEQSQTTLTLSSDHLELFGESIDVMKAKLKIRKLDQITTTWYRVVPLQGQAGYRIEFGKDISYQHYTHNPETGKYTLEEGDGGT